MNLDGDCDIVLGNLTRVDIWVKMEIRFRNGMRIMFCLVLRLG